MSAICGIFLRDHSPLKPEWLNKMTDAAIFPSPDGIQFWSDRTIGFGCLNFYITPESLGKSQPLQDKTNNLYIVADIRLDNRDTLITKLQLHLPNIDKSNSDSELVLAAYRVWSIECVAHLLGDFAFAIWDKSKQELFIARDSLGAKHILYYMDDKQFIFASSPASILSLSFIDSPINEEKVLCALLMKSSDCESTYFQNIYQCPPAHYLVIGSNSFSKRRFWDLDIINEITYRSDDEYSEHLVDILKQAVNDRTRCLGKVGLSLSGGCDSTLLAAIAANQPPANKTNQDRLKTFSYVFDKFETCDERHFIIPVVNALNLDASFILCDDKWTFRDLTNQGFPRDCFFWDCYSNLPLEVMRHASEAGCQILLDGHYGDTLFSGCDYLVSDLVLEKRFRDLLAILFSNRNSLDLRHHIFNYGLRQLIPQSLKKLYRRFQPRQPFLQYFPGATESRQTQAYQLIKSNSDATTHQLPSQRYRYFAFTDPGWAEYSATPESNHRFPVQRYSPYFDRRLVEFVFGLPTEQLSRPGRNRWIQRNAMRQFLPTEVTERIIKTRFEPLLTEGLLRQERHHVLSLTSESLAAKQNWVRHSWLKEEIDCGTPLSHDGNSLSLILHLELWLRSVRDASVHDSWNSFFQYTPSDNALINQ